MRPLILVLAVMAPALGGCVVKSVYNVATLPVRAGGKVVDWTTTSQSEADRNAGRKMRHDREREDRARRDWAKRCRKHPEMPACQHDPVYRVDPRRK